MLWARNSTIILYTAELIPSNEITAFTIHINVESFQVNQIVNMTKVQCMRTLSVKLRVQEKFGVK